MRRPLLLPSFAVLSFAAILPAASLAAPATVANPAACPVELSAAQRADGMLLATDARGVPAPTGTQAQQSIDLSMKNTRLQRIVAAELEVHGTSNKSRVVDAHDVSLRGQPAADAVRDVHLVSSVPAEQQRTRTVGVNLTSVAWISVIELRYADGSTWHAGPGRECRVTPNGMMLVANK